MLKKSSKKPILAIYSLTCCEGCQVELLNLGSRLLEIFDVYVLGHFSWIEDKKAKEHFDIALVEGTPISESDFKNLKIIREKSDCLVAFGTCAHLGGVQRIKNYTEKTKGEKMKYVYKNPGAILDSSVAPIGRLVKVDYIIPGCPIDKDEAFRILSELRMGRSPRITPRPVCYECQVRGYECLLQKGESCLGPITLGGCKGVCLGSKIFCYGCRGPLPGRDPEKHLKNLEKLAGKEYLQEVRETFGEEG